MSKGKTILAKERFALTIDRLCHQLIENYEQFDNACIVGVQPKGVLLSDRIHQRLLEILDIPEIEYGKLDVTFHRDDFRMRDIPIAASITEMDFLVEKKKVILIDDVLYSGRTIQSALAALQHYGRPKQVELLTLVDRRFNRSLPIQSDYTGLTVDAINEAYVRVEWKDGKKGSDRIILFADKEQ
ncbi:MAG: pyrimidine operon attenuation protein/uracil phosphoribosyltransferase [Polaribacter sp.]|jgi:pyrimidine operon attenuation protein/uracil phosphoribosyltransferase